MYLMLPFRRRSSLIPIHRIKHVIDAEGNVDDTPTVVVPIAVTSDTPDLASPTEVETGAKINGFYIHLEALHSSGTGRPNFYMLINKNPGGLIAAINPTNVGINKDKRWVIHQEMILGSGDAGNGLPRPVFNGVIAVPRGMRRMAPGDKWEIQMRTGNTDVAFDWCVQVHYKEFR